MAINDVIIKFMTKMQYLSNEHVLGIVFYGSNLTGFSNAKSDIDMHIIFDNEDPERLIRGQDIIDGARIEYFEKPIADLYASADNDFENQNNALVSIIGKGHVLFERNNAIGQLQDYILKKYSDELPKLDFESTREMISILNNRMEKLESAFLLSKPEFVHLYHLTIEKIRKFYHRLGGHPEIPTSKVVRIYQDAAYRESFSKGSIPESEFVDQYLSAIFDQDDNESKIKKAREIYAYSKRDLDLGNQYRILIKTRNK